MAKFKPIFKEILQSKFQIIIFIFCIILSIGTFVAIDSLKTNVQDFIEQDSKAINGGDVIIDAQRAFSNNLTTGINNLNSTYDNLIFMNSYTFTSVVNAQEKNSTLLAEIRVVSSTYPLYGEVKLESGKEIKDILTNGQIIVEKDLLTRMNLEIGDNLKIGDKTFIIKDVLISEPDQPLTLFKLGPKILVPETNLEDLNLIGDKSRVSYETSIKTSSDKQSLEIVDYLKDFTGDRENVNYYFDNENTLKNFVLNFLFFIKIISLFIIIITGIGMTSIILSYLDDKKQTIGIRKSLGEMNKGILIYYYKTIIYVSLFATILSIGFSYILIKIFPLVFVNILPTDVIISLSLISIFEGLIVSLIITTLFTLYPLILLKKISPTDIFRNIERDLFLKNKSFYIIYLLIVIFFAIFVFIQIENFLISLSLVTGSVLLFLFLYFITNITLKLIKKIRHKITNLELRQALNGLFRIGNKTILVITTITLSLSLIFTISFIEMNLQSQFVTSFPPDAPNLVVLDIPQQNLSDIQKIIGGNITFYPVIRGSILTVNGVDIKTIEDNAGGGDPLTRTFSLTYGELLPSEKIVNSLNSTGIFLSNWNNNNIAQVSVLDETAKRMNAKIGDKIVFLIQGVEIDTEIVSIRSRTSQDIGAFFYFTFEKSVLKNAPQTIFTFSNVNSSQIPMIQNEIIQKFPAVTVINAMSAAKSVGDIIRQLSDIISFFTLFSLSAGILILFSSIVSTNSVRTQEAVFYKLVGANKSFIRKVFIYEYLIIGIISSLIAIIFSSIATYLVTKYLLKIEYIFFGTQSITYSLTTILVIVTIGYLSSINIFRKKPIEYIRENKIE